jgi:hypothetical protein
MHNGPDREIASHAARYLISAGLASEGYNGGYRDALIDVIMFLNGVLPNRNDWWKPDHHKFGGD